MDVSFSVGVDRSKSGWYAVFGTDGRLSSAIYSHFEDLVDEFSDSRAIAVDVPIGLPETYPRTCEKLTKKAIGERRSSVFYTPLRSVFDASSHREASDRHSILIGKGISQQSFAIFEPINEVDLAILGRPEKQSNIYEVHPELCFWAANDQTPLPEAKKKVAGHLHRRTILARVLGEDHFPALRSRHPLKKDAADDDILDALAAYWTATRIAAGEAGRFPENVERDAKGLEMAMWY